MLKQILIITLFILPLFARTPHVDTRFVGIVSEFKVISMDKQENIICWVKISEIKEFYIRDKSHIPNIYVGDSLFEYWVEYQKCCVGSSKDSVMYQIIK
jgi:hypothetical protein